MTDSPKQPKTQDKQTPAPPVEDLLPGGVPREELMKVVQRAIEGEVRHRNRSPTDESD